MGYNREQIRDMFNSRMRSIAINAQRDQDEQDAIAYNAMLDKQKKDEDIAKVLTGLNLAKGVRDDFVSRKVKQTFNDDVIGGTLALKYKYKEGAGLKEYRKNFFKSLGKDIGSLVSPLEETEDYQKFQAIEKIGEGKDPSFDYESLVGAEGADRPGVTGALQRLIPGGETGKEQMTAEEYDKLVSEKGEEYAKQQLLEQDIEAGKYTQEPISEEDILAEAMPEEDYLLRQRVEAGELTQEPISGEDILAEAMPEEDYLLQQRVKSGEFTQEPIDSFETFKEHMPGKALLARQRKRAGLPEDTAEFTQLDPISGEEIAGEFGAEGGFEGGIEGYETAQNIALKRQQLEAAPERIPTTTPEFLQDQSVSLETLGKKPPTREELRSIQPKVPDAKKPPTRAGQVKRISGFDPEGDIAPGQLTPTKGMPEHVPYASGAEAAPITTDEQEALKALDKKPEVEIPDAEVVVPDAKPGLLKAGGDVLKAGQEVAGAVGQLKTLTGEGTDEEKVIAGTQLASTAATKVGEKVTEKVGEKVVEKAGEELGKKGLGEGLKFAGKALGAGVGIYSGLKTAFDEDASDVQKVGGGLQALGSGMAMTGIGAPVGLLVGGVGALMSMFGGGGGAPAPAPAPKPRMDTSRYYQRQRMRRRR